jgi:septal ring factor EnvC (AmiA/AmiB activator)
MEPLNQQEHHSATSTLRTTYQTRSLKKKDHTDPTVAAEEATAAAEDTAAGVEAEAATAEAEAVAEDTAADEAADATDTRN